MKYCKDVKTEYASKTTVIKRYRQYSSGSAYFKVAGQLLELIDAGANVITVLYEGNKRWEHNYKRQVKLVQDKAKNIKINFVAEYS